MLSPFPGWHSRYRSRALRLIGFGALALLTTTAVGSVFSRGGTAAQGAGSAVDAAAMVAAHNRWRQAVGVPDLRWSEELATRAQRWADRLQRTRGCQPEHSPANDIGENVFWASAIIRSGGRRDVAQISAADVVDDWAAERADYDVRSNRCAAGKSCGHYTQVVWKDTREVGCGRAVCADASQLWVCEYVPQGNEVGR